ncbi:[LSU ribosomal protein L11P]-lysine N-methyltransferase [Tissierella praeacuta DSM 18095]|uniref:Ribosomal protein L11 methyltransferase n=1 Tax=Tissierella praeacuta DSM 18095 TaxID=1123404 RepID=A0A1M4S8G1_9FIRM|nr:50S ribosomal protein L11 methyltransferase [Tissierella praeacuta]SHE28480.1 [LSU ribosomal protein L11P]-lysine N-methyltransferase [Tissierella praeacuta DSM 18095]SUP01106.1 Ribosomal protein L11 methyltransferase [Tissierella praeacuta]
MNWTEVQIKTTAELEDLVSNVLYDAGATGLAIEDPRDILELSKSKERWDFVDPSLINSDFDGVLIKAYFSEADDLENKIEEIKNRIKNDPILNTGNNEIKINIIDDNDWAEAWKKYYKPIKIGERILIKPSWEKYVLEENDILIELDPGMAFGTGTHETTMMCTEALEKHVKSGDIVYDIGCGSGILSIVAAKLGAEKVVGVDLDELCVKVSNENIKLNNVNKIVEIKEGNLLDVVDGKANIIVSNIIAEIIAGMTKDLRAYLKDDGIFITSGIIVEKIELVEKALLENGFKVLDIKRLNGWACIIATNN